MFRSTWTRCWRAARTVSALTLALLAMGIVSWMAPSALAAGGWSPTGSLTTERQEATITRLGDGRVLVAGGSVFSADASTSEIYNPTTGVWTAAGSMPTTHSNGAAVLLANGQVLVAGDDGGGYSPDSANADLYNPATGTWQSTESMITGRTYFSAARLQDGRVLVAGGGDSGAGYIATAELYNPTTGTWTATGSMHVAREHLALIPLGNGTVLAIGGDALNYATGQTTVYASAELPRFGPKAREGEENAGGTAGTERDTTPEMHMKTASLQEVSPWLNIP